jgi:putative transposase
LECGSALPLFLPEQLREIIVFHRFSYQYQYSVMSESGTPWPHAPTHQLSEIGTYFVTAGTYLKAHHFRTPERLDVLHRGLLSVARDFSWDLEAWAVLSNHYHFIGRSPENVEESTSLSKMLSVLHRRTAIWVNHLDKTAGRKVWHNFWDTILTYQKSYFSS